jgi:molybdopterin converting factor small subunit
MVQIEVRLYATLRKYREDQGSGEPIIMTYQDNTQLGKLLDDLKIPREEIKTTFVNGKWEEDRYILRDGDRIGIFPPIAGG